MEVRAEATTGVAASTAAGDRDARAARVLWQLYEPIHAVTYFAPEAKAAADATGLRGFWMGYFAMRAAPLGAVGPDVVTAAFYNFPPEMVQRSLPDAWSCADPAAALAARLEGAAAALRSIGVIDDSRISEAADLAWEAAQACDIAGRVLAAANGAQPAPGDPLQRLWQATTTLREHRGDGHVAALVAHGVGPTEAHVLKVAAGEADADYNRKARQIDDDSWCAATETLERRHLVTGGELTDAGRRLRNEIERATDLAAATPWRVLGPDRTRRLAGLFRPIATAVMGSGLLPLPNPIGTTWPPDAL